MQSLSTIPYHSSTLLAITGTLLQVSNSDSDSSERVQQWQWRVPLRLSGSCLSSSHSYSLPPARPPHSKSSTNAPTPCGRLPCRLAVVCSSTRGRRGPSTSPGSPPAGACGRARAAHSTAEATVLAKRATAAACSPARPTADRPTRWLSS